MKIVILVGPSAAGKTTLENHLIKTGFKKIITTTTRPKGNNEKDGKDYYFVNEEKYNLLLKNNMFAENDSNYGQSYGILKSEFQKHDKLITVLNLTGALSVKKLFPKSTYLIFIQPPSIEILRKRLIDRGRDSEDAIKKRLANAKYEIENWRPQCDDYVVADIIKKAEQDIEQAIKQFGL